MVLYRQQPIQRVTYTASYEARESTAATFPYTQETLLCLSGIYLFILHFSHRLQERTK